MFHFPKQLKNDIAQYNKIIFKNQLIIFNFNDIYEFLLFFTDPELFNFVF